MDQIFQWITQHHGIVGIAAFWVFSALVSGMPAPVESSGVGYVWLYNTLHLLASNLNSLFAKKAGTVGSTDLAPHVTPQPPEVK